MRRKLSALDQVEARERKGLAQARMRERRQRINARHEHMPTFALELKPPGRKPKIEKAKNRFISPLARELAEAAQERQANKKVKLTEEFARAAREEGEEGDSSGSASTALAPAGEPKIERSNRYAGDLSREFNAAAEDSGDQGGDGGLSPKPDDPGGGGSGNSSPTRPRRTRKRDLDRGR